jgi:hypothetical protein
MKHASARTLRELESLLTHIRGIDGLVERKPGIFYRGSSAFLHFHEDASGFFADVKLNGASFERMPVSTAQERRVFWHVVRSGVARTLPSSRSTAMGFLGNAT